MGVHAPHRKAAEHRLAFRGLLQGPVVKIDSQVPQIYYL